MPTATNGLIARLPPKEQTALVALCERADLVFGTELHQPDTPLAHVYFPLTGHLSLVSVRPGMHGIEVGMAGREGMAGAQLVLGAAPMPLLVLVQGAGTALRLSASAFREQLAANAGLEKIVRRYVGTLLSQFAAVAPCLRFHSIAPRLARWLLMTDDRVGTGQFQATHEFLSYMLGVRRAGVTEAAGALQVLGAIRYERGCVTIVDRLRLEKAACSCYAADREAFRVGMRVQRAVAA